MSDPIWTPGEWKVKPVPAGGGILIRAPDDLRHPQTHLQIAPIEDARLMAAAPALFRALRRFVRKKNCESRTGQSCLAAHREKPCRVCEALAAMVLAIDGE